LDGYTGLYRFIRNLLVATFFFRALFKWPTTANRTLKKFRVQNGKEFYLNGYLKNEDLTLKENNQDYKLNGVFHTPFTQQTIEGRRTNYDKSKSTPVFLKRQFIE